MIMVAVYNEGSDLKDMWKGSNLKDMWKARWDDVKKNS